MELAQGLLLGETARSLDDRYRLSLPTEFAQQLVSIDTDDRSCLLAKERPGCLSLWNYEQAKTKLEAGVELVAGKIGAGRLDARQADVQALGRLLSTRHRQVPLAGRGRLVIPEGFRDFLGVSPGDEVMLVGAAVCLEIWNPKAWREAIAMEMPAFRELFDGLSS